MCSGRVPERHGGRRRAARGGLRTRLGLSGGYGWESDGSRRGDDSKVLMAATLTHVAV